MSGIHIHRHGRLALAVRQYGHGDDIVIALHGYGQSGEVYQSLTRAVSDDITVYAFDLFFHSESTTLNQGIDPKEPLSASEWSAFIESFIVEKQVETFHLITYSMGSRLGMSLCHSMPHRLNKVKLIAPDGFIENTWYRFAVRTSIGRNVFKQLPRQYRRLHVFGDLLSRVSLLDKKMHKVALENTATSEKCQQLYNTWMFLRMIRPDVNQLSKVLEMQSIDLEVHLGKYDRLIPPHKVLTWSYLLKMPEKAVVHAFGHNLLKDALFKELCFSNGL